MFALVLIADVCIKQTMSAKGQIADIAVKFIALSRSLGLKAPLRTYGFDGTSVRG